MATWFKRFVDLHCAKERSEIEKPSARDLAKFYRLKRRFALATKEERKRLAAMPSFQRWAVSKVALKCLEWHWRLK